MAIVNGGRGRSQVVTTDPVLPSEGAWTQSDDGQWSWMIGATPDPDLVQLWGNGAMTDVRRDPTGERNYGAWTPVRGGGWQWQWARTPDPRLVDRYGTEALSDPDKLPNSSGPGAEGGPNTTNPPLPQVNPPVVADVWNGTPPNITGDVPHPQEDGTPIDLEITEPPSVRAFVVSPGAIRDAETAILAEVDSGIASYQTLTTAVNNSMTQNAYPPESRNHLLGAQTQVLLQVSDAITAAGRVLNMLNIAAQSYAKADMDSFLQES